ncbi:DUF406 family protein [Paraferrimonas haliotis]|uniref:DUF406 family protein n=1 Tax=Paraferrimonas haliotis TaxID=2013866 RepID=UPI0015CEE3BA|nr:DUF406 family protein [Paraferrimonas haliotis]
MSNDNPLTQVADCCGNFVEIGTVISETDTEMTLNFGDINEASLAQLELQRQAIVARFNNAQVKQVEANGQLQLQVIFEVAAEKLIYQMSLR